MVTEMKGEIEEEEEEGERILACSLQSTTKVANQIVVCKEVICCRETKRQKTKGIF